MELLRRLSLRNAGIEIVKRTITEEYPEKGQANQWNNNDNRTAKGRLLFEANGMDQIDPVNGHVNEEFQEGSGNDDDFVVIELVDEEEVDSTDFDEGEKYVDINMKSSKQILIYLARKRRLLITCRTRAVSHAPLLEKFSTGRTVLYLRPFFRLTISPTEYWYVTHRSSLFVKPVNKKTPTKPIHYTEKVEFHDGPDAEISPVKKPDLSGVQLIFSDETSNEVSKLTLSSDFTSSYEEKHSKLEEISRDIELSEDNDDRGTLRRSYSIEFLNEESNGDVSFSAEDVARKIEEGEGKDIYDDSMGESASDSRKSFDGTSETSTLKRSFSVEFLNEDEDRPFSSEIVHYKLDKGEGVLVYSDFETTNDSKISSDFEEQQPLKRSYSIEFLNESDEKRSGFTYETVSNKIEKGEGRLIYDDEDEEPSSHNASRNKRPCEKLKTLGVKMHNDELNPGRLGEQQKGYSIELLNEIGDDEVYDDDHDDYSDEEIVPTQLIAEESAMDDDFFDRFEESSESQYDDPNVERKSFNMEILDEKPGLNLDLKETSTPMKQPLQRPKKSPLQTVHIGVEFEKRIKSENDDDEMFMDDADEYLVYEGKSGTANDQNGAKERHRIPSFKLETIVVNMDTHHERKRPSMFQDRRFQLEFQSERERRISMLREARKARLQSGSSSGLRTVSIETDAEEVIHDENELKPPELLKRKAYSVEYLNEMEGDRSVFYEEFVDEDEPRWTLEI